MRQAGAEDRIDDQNRSLSGDRLQLRSRDRQTHRLDDLPVRLRFIDILFRIGRQKYFHRELPVVEMPGDGKPVAAIVSAAAENENFTSVLRRNHAGGDVCRGDGGVFHQHFAGNVISLHRQAVDLANLLTRETDHLVHYTAATC